MSDFRIARPVPIVAGVLFAVVLVGVASAVGGALHAACEVRLFSQTCTFTNTGLILPASQCVQVTITKTKMSAQPSLGSAEADAAFRRAMDSVHREPEAAVGTKATSTVVCSGFVWGRTTSTVTIPSFDRNVGQMCRNMDNCEMGISVQ